MSRRPRLQPARRSLRRPALGAANSVLIPVPPLRLVRVGLLDHLRLDHALGPMVFSLTLDTALRVAVSLARLGLALGPLRRGSRHHRQLAVRSLRRHLMISAGAGARPSSAVRRQGEAADLGKFQLSK